MPRGKDAPGITGGQIDPYVASTMQQNKQQSENRLLTAMQEKGATERAGITASAQLGAQKMRSDTAIQTQAAQSEADDRRAAEAERGSREDNEYKEAMLKVKMDFDAAEAQLQREYDTAAMEEKWERLDELDKRQDAREVVNNAIKYTQAERSTNAVLSMIEMGINKEAAGEKAQTTIQEETKEFEQNKIVYRKTKENVTASAEGDDRLNLPIKGEFRLRGKLVTPRMGFGAGYAQIPVLKPGTAADPMGVLQTQISNEVQNPAISVEALGNPLEIANAIKAGKITAVDIVETIGTLQSVRDVYKIRRDKFKGGTEEYKFWNQAYQQTNKFRRDLEKLGDNTDRLEGSETRTVGSEIEGALKFVYDRSFGGQAAILKETYGQDTKAIFNDMRKAMDVKSYFNIPDNATPYEKEMWEAANRSLTPWIEGGVE